MVLLTSLVALAVMQGSQGTESLLAQLIPMPTGKNGYEDYLHAADLADPDLFSMYDQWLAYKARLSSAPVPDSDDQNSLPPIPPGVSPEMTFLAVRKAESERLASAYEILALGNRKEVRDPRQTYSFATKFPEMARFKTLAKIGVNKAYVEFSEGRTKQAVDDLIEGMRFSRNVFGTTMISSLVSIAMQAVFLSEFQRHLGQLSLYDAQTIDRTCQDLIEHEPSLREMFRPEMQMAVTALDTVIDNPNELLSEDERKAFGTTITGLGPSDRQQLKSMISQGLQQRFDDMESKLCGPESGWPIYEPTTDPPVSLDDKSVSNLALLLINALQSKDMQSNVAKAIAKGRIQLRLLQLHAKVIEYNWQNNKLPLKIEDFAGKNAAVDPFTGESFRYELRDGTYRLYSIGIPSLGPIELRYKAPAVPQNSGVDHPS